MTESLILPGGVGGVGAGAGAPKLLHVSEEFASGTQQPLTPGAAWSVRPLNTILVDEIGVTLAAGVLTLPAGTYEADGYGVARMCATHRIRLYNVTAADVIRYGTAGQSSQSSTYAQTSSKLFSRFTLDVESDIQLEHKVETGPAGASTLGIATVGSTGPELYSELILRKLS